MYSTDCVTKLSWCDTKFSQWLWEFGVREKGHGSKGKWQHEAATLKVTLMFSHVVFCISYGPICELFKGRMVKCDSLDEQAWKTSTAADTSTQNTEDYTIFRCCGGAFQEYQWLQTQTNTHTHI